MVLKFLTNVDSMCPFHRHKSMPFLIQASQFAAWFSRKADIASFAVNVLDNSPGTDVRVPSNLVNGLNQSDSSSCAWLAPLASSLDPLEVNKVIEQTVISVKT